MKDCFKYNELPLLTAQGKDLKMLSELEQSTFEYFRYEVNEENGLVADKTEKDSPASISSIGMALCAYIVAVENGYMPREQAVHRTLTTLKFFFASKQGTEIEAAGFKGFYYHFLDMKTGKRTPESELSTIDTAVLLAGILAAGNYYNEPNNDEQQIRQLATELYTRVDWRWALNGENTFTHGWKPKEGFLDSRWNQGYSEALILYILALGSPSFPVGPEGYRDWTATFEWRNLYGFEHFYAGPLFIHQLSQNWLDLRGIRDDVNKQRGIDYFENCRRATYIQQQYAMENPWQFDGYGENSWGFTASNGPGPSVQTVNGVKREFFGYIARGVPDGPDDGTVAPWAAVASLPFAPEIVLNCVRYSIEKYDLKKYSKYGFDASFNATFPEKKINPNGWISSCQYGLNQGSVLLMIENYKTGLIWRLMKKCPYIIKGLERAGFS